MKNIRETSPLNGRGGVSRKGGRRMVIIGNGPVGHRFCQDIVSRGLAERLTVTVFGEETEPAYDRIHLTDFFRGRDGASLSLSPREWYADNGICLHTGDPVERIDLRGRYVVPRSGRKTEYDHLVLVTGSRAYMPEIPGIDHPAVFVYRTLRDVEAIKAFARGARTAAVVGGGLLGLEAARALHDLDLETYVIENGAGPMRRQLPPEASDILRRHIEGLGVSVLTGRQTRRIDSSGSSLELVFEDGPPLKTDMAVFSAGVRPRDELAAAAGLKTGAAGGIIVDDVMRTSDPSVYAIGECALHKGRLYGLAIPGFEMAGVLCRHLEGEAVKFRKRRYATRLKLLGLDVQTLGDNLEPGSTISHRTDGGFREFVFQHSHLIGATILGPCPELGAIQADVERRRFFRPWTLRALKQRGTVWQTGCDTEDPSSWPAGMIVCNCRSVSAGVLQREAASGNATVESLGVRTGAGTVCGSCRIHLARLAGSAERFPARAGLLWVLGIVALVALALTILIPILPPVPFATSVQHFSIDVLWRSGGIRQVTGFTLLGLALISLLLSLRKRIAALAKWGDFQGWRIAHAGLGVLCLLVLVTHTGFRLGANFNRVLLLNFLALALWGAVAAGAVAFERRLSPQLGGRLRRAVTGVHILMCVPLPAFLIFHILTAYYY